jgi:hypothetical protein
MFGLGFRGVGNEEAEGEKEGVSNEWLLLIYACHRAISFLAPQICWPQGRE